MDAHENDEDENSLLLLLPLVQRLVLSSINREKFPFTKTQLSIFSLLYSRNSMTMKEVANYISSSREQATRAVAPLVDEGYVERFVDPSNRTHIHIRLTPKGDAYLRECWHDFHQNITRQLQDRLTPEEQRQLNESLNKVIGILSKM